MSLALFLPLMLLLCLDVSRHSTQTSFKEDMRIMSSHFFTNLTFHSLSSTGPPTSLFLPQLQGDESCDWSAFPAGNERASLRGLFKQRVIWLQSCSRTAFHVMGRPALLTQPTWVIVPYQVLISEVFLACKRVHGQRNIIVISVCFACTAMFFVLARTVR